MTLDKLPNILALNKNYEPIDWIDYEEYAIKYAKGNILASLGQHETTLHGGTNDKTGLQTTLIMDSIVVVDSTISPHKYRKNVPILSNNALFKRDRNQCCYCGQVFNERKLTRDHVQPLSKGGCDVWSNVCTACSGCNSYKDDQTPEQAGLVMLYYPYQPTSLESFILKNRRILYDQQEFLLKMLPANSRLHQQLN